jgi:hypothetical protein
MSLFNEDNRYLDINSKSGRRNFQVHYNHQKDMYGDEEVLKSLEEDFKDLLWLTSSEMLHYLSGLE